MSGRFVLGLDLGGSGARAALVELETRRTVVATRPFTAVQDPDAPAAHRFDPREAWLCLCEAAAEARERLGAPAAAIHAVAATSMRHGSVLLDAAGNVLLATPNRDARGFMVAGDWAAVDGAELQRRTGRWPHPILPASRLRAIATQAPELAARIATHLSISDWLAFELCGERATDPTQAGESLVFDLATRRFEPDLAERLGLPLAWFPPVHEPGSALGPVREAAARELGIARDAQVCVGAADSQCALLGAGAFSAGDWCAVLGSTAPLLTVHAEPLMDPRLWTGHAPVARHFVLESNAGSIGAALDWLASALYADAPHPLLRLLADAATCPAGAGGALSRAAGQVMDARALELPVAVLSWTPFAGSDGPARRAALARALLEGALFALRANAEQLSELCGAAPARLIATGGLSRSAFFTQLLSDVSGIAVDVPAQPDSTALGAALCAAVGSGAYPSFEHAAAEQVRIARQHQPDPGAHAAHAASYQTWRALRHSDAAARAAVMGHALRGLAAPSARRAAPGTLRPRVLVASDMDDASLDALRRSCEVEYASFRKASRLLRGDALVTALEGVQVFVTEIDVVEASALVRCRDLRVIAVCRGDAVNVDVAACTALGIPVVHTPGRNADAVADLTLSFLLMLARRLPEATAYLHEPGSKAGDLGRMGRAFATLQGRELWRRPIGLIGFGAVGHKVLERLRGFGAQVFVHDPVLDDDAVRAAGAEPLSLPELLARCDFISLHAAVTDASRGLIGAQQLAAMRPGACLVNTARAALIDENALLESLRSGHLGGAALDVFAVEPPASDHPLLALPNVIATPHVGGNTRDVAAHQGSIVVDELTRLLAGTPPRHCLNPHTLAEFSWTAPRREPPADLLAKLGSGPAPAVSDLLRDAAGRGEKG